MRLLYLLADFFIATFGITQPTPKARDQAAWFIAGLFTLMILGLTAIGLLAMRSIRP
jgi:hypothetical protein